jgi:hypothetical protein
MIILNQENNDLSVYMYIYIHIHICMIILSFQQIANVIYFRTDSGKIILILVKDMNKQELNKIRIIL